MMSVILLYPFASFATLYYDRGDETNADTGCGWLCKSFSWMSTSILKSLYDLLFAPGLPVYCSCDNHREVY